MPQPSARARTKCMRIQTKISKSVPHIEALVGAVVGEGWVEVVNAERAREGRRPYRRGGSDERAALALFAHAPGVRDRWPAAARAASQLGGILNAAHHNDGDRWVRGDESRAEDLALAFQTFLEQHPADALTGHWHVTVDRGTLPPRKRKPLITTTVALSGDAGQPLAELAEAACSSAFADGPAELGPALVAIAVAAAARPSATGHVTVEYRDSTCDPAAVAILDARRSDATGDPVLVSVSL